LEEREEISGLNGVELEGIFGLKWFGKVWEDGIGGIWRDLAGNGRKIQRFPMMG
jgi:hypothetical protein